MNKKIEKAVEILKRGGVVVFPTDTVWGIGASVESNKGMKKLYRIKKRERQKPTALLVADVKMAERYGVIKGKAKELVKSHWPGALTLVVKAKRKVPDIIQKNGKVGLRVTDSGMVNELCSELNGGIVAGSANFAGEALPKKKNEIDIGLVEKVDLVMDGKVGGGEASTVVEVVEDKIKVLRQGSIEVKSDWEEY